MFTVNVREKCLFAFLSVRIGKLPRPYALAQEPIAFPSRTSCSTATGIVIPCLIVLMQCY